MSTRRRWLRVLLGGTAVVVCVGAFPGTASAHPLGNLSVNHFHGLTIQPDRIIDDAVVDTAEIPTAQTKGSLDTDRDGTTSPDELQQYGRSQCAALSEAVTLTVDGQPVRMAVTATSFEFRAGQASLPTGRLECKFEAPIDASVARSVVLTDSFLADRVGWHEITAVGDGVTLVNSPVPTESISGRLENYPNDLLSSPLAVKKVTLDTRPGASGATAAATTNAPKPKNDLSIRGIGPFNGVAERINESFNDLVGRKHLTVGVGLLAISMALVVGASHAMLPGHGKTVMAAYIAGTQGSVRDAVLVGTTVTATHTGGVLALGLALTLSSSLAGEVVLGWLGLASGLLIAGLGISLVRYARRGDPGWHGHTHGLGGHVHAAPAPRKHDHHDDHRHPHGHSHGHHDHDHDNDHGHDHDRHDHGHEHDRHNHAHTSGNTALLVRDPKRATVQVVAAPRKQVSRRGLLGMGVAGGLVPSPSALVVLLSAIALGRTVFGVILVIAYGVGMAGTLTLAGVLLVRLRDRYAARSLERRGSAALRRWGRIAPYATASLVFVVGLGLAVRSLALV
ncbi:MAG: nickel transporter [Acidimicrobiales bacterium]